jgi:hypothetical protein
VIAGFTDSFGAGDSDVYLVKVDVRGNMQWQKTFGGEGSEYADSMVQTSDGGYAMAGSNGFIGYMVKTDVEGEFGLARTDSTANTLSLYRGLNDVDWNYVRVRIWKID